MLDPVFQTTETLEANMQLYGFTNYPKLTDEEAKRLGEIIIEWSKR